ncbi:MAG TPA: response regulator [Noviherbaspirillum sp.]|uniref:response regulator n=1 Tax=Noviherbaspirillum sp. TaxID=1926288 RepID=UPI002F92725E
MAKEGADARPSTILIVDDEERNRRLLEVFVRADGYRTVTADCGENGIALARSGRPDLILLDLMMPGLDGFDAARALNADPRTAAIPVVIVTSLDDAGARSRSATAGAAALIVKPVDRWQLSEVLRRLLQPRGDGGDARG